MNQKPFNCSPNDGADEAFPEPSPLTKPYTKAQKSLTIAALTVAAPTKKD